MKEKRKNSSINFSFTCTSPSIQSLDMQYMEFFLEIASLQGIIIVVIITVVIIIIIVVVLLVMSNWHTTDILKALSCVCVCVCVSQCFFILHWIKKTNKLVLILISRN